MQISALRYHRSMAEEERGISCLFIKDHGHRINSSLLSTYTCMAIRV